MEKISNISDVLHQITMIQVKTPQKPMRNIPTSNKKPYKIAGWSKNGKILNYQKWFNKKTLLSKIGQSKRKYPSYTQCRLTEIKQKT